jgi:hypothetical protein
MHFADDSTVACQPPFQKNCTKIYVGHQVDRTIEPIYRRQNACEWYFRSKTSRLQPKRIFLDIFRLAQV